MKDSDKVLINAYLDGETSTEESKRIEELLHSDSDAREYAEGLKVTNLEIDAFANEPIDTNSRLKKLGDKVILSPHMVSSNQASGLGPGYKWATNAVLQALAGEVPNNVFNPEVIERWRERFGGTTPLTANEPIPDHPGYGPPNP